MRNVSSITAVVISFQTLAGAQQVSFASEQVVQPLQRDSVLWGDFDLDGLDDLYRLDPVAGDRLLRNVGDGTFEDVTPGALPPATGPSRRATFVDLDGDRHLDLHLIGAGGESRVLRNTGFSAFEDVTLEASIVHDEPARAADWRDYDADGLPDLRLVLASRDRLFHNAGEGRFEEVELPGSTPAAMPDRGPARTGVVSRAVEPSPPGSPSLEPGVAMPHRRQPSVPVDLSITGLRSSEDSARSSRTPGAPVTRREPAEPSRAPRTSAGASLSICAESVRDQVTDLCLRASSLPTLGLLFPYPGTGNVLAHLAFVGGGENNQASGSHATIVGGRQNTAGGLYASVGGGSQNLTEDGMGCTIGGGVGNYAAGTYGGYFYTYSGDYQTVSGGASNRARFARGATIGGGVGNYAGGTFFNYYGNVAGNYATVSGGARNTARAGKGTTIGGGIGNYAGGEPSIFYAAHYATVAGGMDNTSLANAGTIGGGRGNSVSGDYGSIGGGNANTASGRTVFVGGGLLNEALGDYSAVAGGNGNTASGKYAAIGGGRNNRASKSATVAAGTNNDASGYRSTIGGGHENTAFTNATIGGGAYNDASGVFSTIGGGQSNTASARRSTVAGGRGNTAAGRYAFVGGGTRNSAQGGYSFAAGRRAMADHVGAFVWGDSIATDKASSGRDEFNVYAGGGARIFSSSDGSTGVLLAAGGGSWSSVSDVAAKENLAPVDSRAVLARVLAMPISTWNYRAQDDSIRHMGPMAQDFRAAFGLGISGKLIDTVDPDGVALAAIQGLHETTRLRDAELEARLAQKDEEIARLQADVVRMGDLESAVVALERELARVTRLLSVASGSR